MPDCLTVDARHRLHLPGAAEVAANVPLLAPLPPSQPRPFWSVLIPTHERTEYLAQCIGCVVDQAPPPDTMEIIVHDESPRANLRPIVEAAGRGRVRFEKATRWRGQFGNVNEGLSLCRGHWIHILHDDDFVLPGFYQVLQKALAGQGDLVAMACTHYSNIDERGTILWRRPPLHEGPGLLENWLDRITVGNPLNVPAVVQRRLAFERIGLFREDLPYTGDWEFYIRAALHFSWWCQPEDLARCRVHPNNVTSASFRAGQAPIDIRRTLEIAQSYFPPEVQARVLPPARQYQSGIFLRDAITCLNTGQIPLGMTYLQECLKLNGEVHHAEILLDVLRQVAIAALPPELFHARRRLERTLPR